MADNISLNTNVTTGSIVSADSVTESGTEVKYQQVKNKYGLSGNAAYGCSFTVLTISDNLAKTMVSTPCLVHAIWHSNNSTAGGICQWIDGTDSTSAYSVPVAASAAAGTERFWSLPVPWEFGTNCQYKIAAGAASQQLGIWYTV